MRTSTVHDTFGEMAPGAWRLHDAAREPSATRTPTTTTTTLPTPDVDGVLRHLLEHHGRTELDMSPCRDRLSDLHRFEHTEAQFGLVWVGHAHP